MSENRKALVRYRIEQADESLASARLLVENDKLRSSVSGAYYTMFYCVLALLAIKGRSISKHSGVIFLFDMEFIKTNIFSKDFSQWLHEAFDLRQRSDYREMLTVSIERAQAVLTHAHDFLASTRKYLQAQSWFE